MLLTEISPYKIKTWIQLVALTTAAVILIVYQANSDLKTLNSNMPVQTAQKPAPAVEKAELILALFGDKLDTAEKPSTAALPQSRLKLTITGIFAGLDSSGQVLIAEHNLPATMYQQGDELPGGAKISSIKSDHVILLRGGNYERLLILPLKDGKQALNQKSLVSTKMSGQDLTAGIPERYRQTSIKERLARLRNK